MSDPAESDHPCAWPFVENIRYIQFGLASGEVARIDLHDTPSDQVVLLLQAMATRAKENRPLWNPAVHKEDS